jgi:hypothetical protein
MVYDTIAEFIKLQKSVALRTHIFVLNTEFQKADLTRRLLRDQTWFSLFDFYNIQYFDSLSEADLFNQIFDLIRLAILSVSSVWIKLAIFDSEILDVVVGRNEEVVVRKP